MEPLIEYKEMREAIARVRELHKPASDGRCLGCDNRCSCFEGDMANWNRWETCPTIQALDGEQ